jgi:hypothetical protein
VSGIFLSGKPMPYKNTEARRARYKANRPKIAAQQKAWREANKDKVHSWADAYKERRKQIDAKPEHQARRREYARQYHRDNPDQWIESNKKIKPKRAVTEPTYLRNRELLAGRPKPTRCDICSGATRRIVFDHCHQKGHFRGWLCEKCNITLGMVNDDVQHLRKLIAYLERNRTSTAPQLALAGI